MRTFLSLLILIIMLQINISAQKVGVVFSGGGAKGLAHIGVIRALEENNIPIDYITGTSMGAIVGALYSIGYTTDEMEKLFMSEEFEIWSKGIIEDRYVYFFKKEPDNASWLSLKFTSDSSATKTYLPTNVVPNHQMDFAFMHLLAKGIAAAKYNFDSLMIPFRCVASDVYAKEAIVFRSGDLSSSVRASMTFPLYFKPLVIDNRLLFDGGIYNNFPVDVMQQDFNPDYIIGCNVSSNSSKPDQDDVLAQIENMIADITNYTVPAEKGILIEPVLYNVGLMDFYRCNELSSKGYNATMAKIGEIKRLISVRRSPEQVQKMRQDFIAKEPELIFDSIYIDGLKGMQRKYAYKVITKKKEKITLEQLKKEYFKLITDGHIEYIYPKAVFNTETQLFDIRLKMKKAKSFTAKIGGNISSTSLNTGFAEIEYRYLASRAYKINANSYFGRFYSSLLAKARIDFSISFPYYIDGGFVYNSWDYVKGNPELFINSDQPSYLVLNESHFEVNAGVPIKINGKICIGTNIGKNNHKYYQTSDFELTDEPDKTSFKYIKYELGYHAKTLNKKQFSYKGYEVLIKATYIKGKEIHYPGTTAPSDFEFTQKHEYPQFRIYYDTYFRPSKKFNIGIQLDAVYSFRTFYNNYQATTLSAPAYSPTPFSKTVFFEKYRAFQYVGFGLKAIFKITEDFHYRAEGYIFQPYKEIIKKDKLSNQPFFAEQFVNRYLIGSTGFVYHTILGPASLNVEYFQKSGTKFFFIFNFGYILFNNKGLD